MLSQDGYLSSKKDSSHRGFHDLYMFLRDAFQQRGLISVPPEVLQLFKQCPLQDIECPDMASFAKLFEGTRSSNRFRLEANSFVYTVQILFHLRPNLLQERVLYLLMVSVRLLKDEKRATQRLSELAGKEIDRHAVARKRVTISNKLVPWLLKHFSQDSTIARLKVIAAQFLFHLLQGDEEAKNILKSGPERERRSLGRAVSASSHVPLRILAANILRETSLADIDVRLFWPHDLLHGNDPRLPSSFIADSQWLHDTVLYLRDFDDHRAFSVESREETHEILSLRLGSLAFSDVGTKALATISERLIFIIPAHQNRPLQILEVPLVANVEYDRSDGTVTGEGIMGGQVKLRLQLRNTGSYILNGLKSAIDQLDLTFATNDGREGFCQCIANSLQNINIGQPDVDKEASKSRPKKQSRAVMIDLSQDVVISGDTQLLSPSLKTPLRVSTSQLIDVSESRESSVSRFRKSSMSPLRESVGRKAAPAQPGEGNRSLLHDTHLVQQERHHHRKLGVETNSYNRQSGEALHNVGVVSDPKELAEYSVAPARPGSDSQKRSMAETTEGHLPQQMHSRGLAEIRPPGAASNLQHLALDALQHSENPFTATLTNTDLIAHSEGGSHSSSAAQPGHSTPRSLLPPSALANSGRRIAPKPASNKQVATNSMTTSREQNGGTAGKKSRTFLKRSNAAKSLPAGETAVDWDEDLRVDEDEDKELSSPTKRPTSAASRSTRTGPKKPAGAKKAPKVSSPGKKGIKKVKSKDNVMQAASVKVSLAATRPRRAAANVSYGEQSEQEEQSQDRVHGRNDTVNHAETDQTSATATFLNTDNDHVLRKAQSVDDQNPGDASETPFGGDEPLFIPTEAAVKIPRSSEEAPAAIEPITNPKKYGADTDPSGPGKASFRDQKEKESKLGHDLSERTERPEVEAVDDSHPMDKDQRVDAIGAARKSFGSALMDVMKETGMRPIATPHPDETRTKPFGDKASFIDSVKTALMQSPSKPGTHAPSLDRTRHVHGSDRIKHVQTPSTSEQESYAATWRRPANGTSQSVRTGSQQPLEELASHQRLDEGVGETTQTQTANAAMPTAASERLKSPSETLPFPQQRKPDTSQAKPTREDHTSRSNDMNAGSSRSTRSIELPEPSAKSDSPAPRLPLGDKATEINNNGRKRGSPPQFEKPQQTKRARKADPGPKRSKINDKSMQSPAQLLLPTVNVTGHSPKTKVGVPKPSAAESKKIIQSDEASGVLHTEKKQTPAQIGVWQRDHPEVRSSANASKLIPSKAQTPNHLTVVGDIPTLTDDQLHRKAQIVDFSARGPRNQGVSSSGRREHAVGQASSVPTETGKHLAFKNLRTDLKAVGRPGKAGANSSLLFGSHGKREVQFSFSDRESTDDGIYADEESAEDAAPAPAISDLENGKSASQTSKVDENGSPRLRLPKISRPSLLSNDSTALQDPRDLDESVGTTSVPECSESEELQSNESSNFDLEAAVSKYTAANVQMTATLKDTRSRPSIGLGKLLNDSFPQASKSIETNVFKRAILADATAPSRSFQKSKSTDKPNGDRSLGRTVVTQGSPNKAMTADHDDTTSFDIDELNVSVAHEQPSSAASFRVRRLRSGTTPSPGGEAPRPDGSPASFNTRLAKMIMPPPARKEQSRVDVAEEDESGLHVGRDRSIMIDAETTLVNGEAFVKESHLSSPHVQQRLSSSSSDEEEGAPVLVSQQVPPKDIHGERRLWNQKVAETKQTLQETLQQVSQKLLLRFSTAEQGIEFKLDHYHYGGWKIVNSFVQQFDQRVTQEKQRPSPRTIEHRERLDDAMNRLQQARKSTRSGPSLDDLQKSLDKRSKYVLANVEKFATAQQS